jgi:adenylate kinase family enzyme
LPFPGYLYCSKKSAISLCIPPEHLLSANMPFYPDAGSAIKEWAKLPDLDGSQDYRLNKISLFLPECRTYFKKMEYSSAKNTLEINIIKNDRNLNLTLKGIYFDAHINKQIDMKIKPDSEKLEIVFDEKQIPEGIELYLIDDKDNLYDYHKEDRYRLEGKQRVLLDAIEKDKEDIIKKAMSSGENDQIEFKPYIKKGDSKINEIIKTVIAFANTKGGCLIMGISDNIELIGIGKAILKDGSLEAIKNNKGIDEALNEYIIYIKKQISDSLNKEIDYKIDLLQISGLHLILIEINKGSQKLYSNCKTKEIYVRKGSNNARPEPDIELPQLMMKKLEPINFMQ